MIIHNPILTGSFSVNGADLSTITGSVATSASFDARTTYLESTSSILTAASASQSVTSGSLVAASSSLSATSGSLSAASGSFNTRVSALEATGSALSSSLLTVSGSGYATSASLSAASGSFNSRVATIESKYATTGSNTFIGTQVVSGSILQSGSFTSTGTLTAQTLVIQTITSSVVYSSGSNVFGNSLGNSQVFTGSVLITGSLALAGNITSNGTAVVLGSGTSGYLPKFTGTSTIGNSAIYDNGGNIGIGIATSTTTLQLYSGTESNLNFVSDGAGGDQGAIYVQKGTGNGFVFAEENRDFIWRTGAAALTGGGGTQVMRLTNGGNLGLGVTPSAWSGRTAIQLPDAAYIVTSGASLLLGANVYFDGSNRTYISTAAATDYRQVSGEHRWEIAPSGTAGAAITFTQAMTLNDSGRLALGGTTITDNSLLNIQGSTVNHTIGIILNKTNATAQVYGILNQGPLDIYNYTSTSYMMRINASGNLSIGNTNDTYKLDVNGTGRFSGALTGTSAIFSSSVRVNGDYSYGSFSVLGTQGLNWSSVGNDIAFGLATIGTATTGASLWVHTPAPVAGWTSGLGVDGTTNSGDLSTIQLTAYGLKYAGYHSKLALRTTSSDTITNALILDGANSGAATFSSSVTTGSPITIQAAAPYIEWKNVASTRLGYIQHNATNLVYNADTGVHVFNQAATFSSSVHKLNIISLGGVFSTGTSGVACRSIETAYALASCRTSVTKGVQYANGSWYNLFYASQDVYMHYKILLTCASYFAVSAQASNAQDGTDRTFKVQYSYNNGGTWCDSFGATFGAGNGQGTGVISVDQSNAQLIGVRIGFCNGSGSTIIGFTCLAFQSCSLGMTIMNSLG